MEPRGEIPEGLAAALRAFAAGIRQALGNRVLDLRLFGSWARGDAHAESDIDVFVLVDVRDELTRTVPFAVAESVFQSLSVNVSPTVMDRAEWEHLRARERRISLDIEREGVAL